MYDPTASCKGCANKVLASHLKMDLDLGKMVCPECIKNKHIHKEIQKEVFKKDEKEPWELKLEEKQERTEKSGRVGHKCSSCGYSFKVDPVAKTPKNCPYCNSRIMSY